MYLFALEISFSINHLSMTLLFSTEENKKAAIYTATICGVLLLLFIFIRWSVLPPTAPVIEDQIEINLGNEEEGFGEEQPLVKGTPSNTKEENNTQEQKHNIIHTATKAYHDTHRKKKI